MRPWQLALSYMVGGLVRGWVASPFAGGSDDPLLMAAMLLVTGLVFAALGVVTGLWAETF